MKMKKLFRRLSRVLDDSSHYKPIKSGKKKTMTKKGHVPIYVGDEMEQFVVPAELLCSPVFIELLQLSAEEYGYAQSGALRIPCSVSVFRRALGHLLTEADGRRSCDDEKDH